MYLFEPDTDPIVPSACDLLADLGLDVRTVRDALADDRTRHCPDRDPSRMRSWREAGRRVNGGGPGRGIDPDSHRSQPNVTATNQGAQSWLSD